MSQPVKSRNVLSNSGLPSMPRSNFTPAPVTGYTPTHGHQIPQGSRIHMREPASVPGNSVVSASPNKVEARHKPTRVPKSPRVAQARAVTSQSTKISASKQPAKSEATTASIAQAKRPFTKKQQQQFKQLAVCAKQLAGIKPPQPKLDRALQEELAIRKTFVLSWMKEYFPQLPAQDVEFNEDGQLSRVLVQRKWSAKTKWLDVQWQDAQPSFTVKVNRLRKVNQGNKWSLLAGAMQQLVLPPLVKEEGTVRLQRVAQAWKLAANLLAYFKDDPSTFMRTSLQGLKYEVQDKAGFQQAYREGKIEAYLAKVSPNMLADFIPALIVESLEDCRQLMAGQLSMGQFCELLALFPENPGKGDSADSAEVQDKEAVKEKLKQLLGDQYALVGALFQLAEAFNKLVLLRLEDPVLAAAAKNNWGAYLYFLGFSAGQYRSFSHRLPDAERQPEGKKLVMMIYHLVNNAGEYFQD